MPDKEMLIKFIDWSVRRQFTVIGFGFSISFALISFNSYLIKLCEVRTLSNIEVSVYFGIFEFLAFAIIFCYDKFLNYAVNIRTNRNLLFQNYGWNEYSRTFVDTIIDRLSARIITYILPWLTIQYIFYYNIFYS